MVADKRIPVTESTWELLSRQKEPGQTYDELLQELMEEHQE